VHGNALVAVVPVVVAAGMVAVGQKGWGLVLVSLAALLFDLLLVGTASRGVTLSAK